MIMNRFILLPSDHRFYCLNELITPMKYPILPGTAGSGEVTDILSANPKKGISSGTNYTIIKEARTVIFSS